MLYLFGGVPCVSEGMYLLAPFFIYFLSFLSISGISLFTGGSFIGYSK